MIKKAYVSFETAKLLKEKGFEIKGYLRYNTNGTKYNIDLVPSWELDDIDDIDCPTQQRACAWLREKNLNICMMIVPWKGKPYWAYSIYTVKEPFSIDYVDGRDDDTPYFETYEDAVEAAIKYVLENLI